MTLNVVNSIIKLVCWMVRIRVFREEDAATLELSTEKPFKTKLNEAWK